MESGPYDFKFRVTNTGRYTIDVNLNDMTMIVEPIGSSGLEKAEINDFYNIHISNKTATLHIREDIPVQTAGIYDVTGRCLNLISDIQSSAILADNLADGIYIIKINSNNKEFIQKIMVK